MSDYITLLVNIIVLAFSNFNNLIKKNTGPVTYMERHSQKKLTQLKRTVFFQHSTGEAEENHERINQDKR